MEYLAETLGIDMTTPEGRAVVAIIDDLNGRSGMGIDSADLGIQREIAAEWVGIVRQEMEVRCGD